MTSSPTGPAGAEGGAGDFPEDPPPGTPAIVLGHADFAAGLASAVATMTGRGELLLPLTNREAAVDEIERRLAEAVDRTGARVIFTDLPAGSCAFAARRLQRARPELVVVTGASMAALVDYVFHAGLPPAEAAAHAVDAARRALVVVPAAAPAGGGAGTPAGGTRAG